MTDQPTEPVPSSEPAEDYPEQGEPGPEGDKPDEVVEPEAE